MLPCWFTGVMLMHSCPFLRSVHAGFAATPAEPDPAAWAAPPDIAIRDSETTATRLALFFMPNNAT